MIGMFSGALASIQTDVQIYRYSVNMLNIFCVGWIVCVFKNCFVVYIWNDEMHRYSSICNFEKKLIDEQFDNG